MVLIYITCKDQEEATKLGKIVLDHKIAACINTWPIKSISRDGNEQLKEIEEVILLIKTVPTDRLINISPILRDNVR